jgi:TPR repeat protein
MNEQEQYKTPAEVAVEAEKWFQKAIAIIAAHNGRDEEAACFMQWAAIEDHPAAQFSMGWMAECGIGERMDYRKACKWYKMAAEQGHPEGMLEYARHLVEEIAIPQDLELAFKLILKASLLGYPKAACWLGHLYERGIFVQKNQQLSDYWYNQEETLPQWKTGLPYRIRP